MRYLSSLKVSASYHILFLLTSRLEKALQNFNNSGNIFPQIVRYGLKLPIKHGDFTIFDRLMLLKDFLVTIRQWTIRHVRKMKGERFFFFHSVWTVSPATAQTDSGTFYSTVLCQSSVKYNALLRDHAVGLITGNGQIQFFQHLRKLFQLQPLLQRCHCGSCFRCFEIRDCRSREI